MMTFDFLCASGVVVAAGMFVMVFIIVRKPTINDAEIARARYNFVLQLLETARGTYRFTAALFLATIALLRGTGKVAFIGSGLLLAITVVGGTCPTLLQFLIEKAAKYFTMLASIGPAIPTAS